MDIKEILKAAKETELHVWDKTLEEYNQELMKEFEDDCSHNEGNIGPYCARCREHYRGD